MAMFGNKGWCNVSLPFVHCASGSWVPINDRVSIKPGGVVNTLMCIYPSPPVRVPTTSGCLPIGESDFFFFRFFLGL